ncbi:hypothetical protein Ppa06_10820 [Planomonospora parontospora subsp. parontospora]|uniref:Uncharacterized protein n=2 Tax=Planomonospora parontospora TaxID=58119 RepID=A0AA37F3F5_9ACTN|nr:hypothetical protein [Planomonospora parontospora]GGK56170.1 hypothetical protein GCM10010126_14750 [Planomonospora parontospora]GII07284.1 hypothetical protein Ppa06_10820 [Planomonospora parontospora subsp. parontospora]
MISNHVLAQWDSKAGALTPRDRRRFAVAGCVGLVLIVAGLVAWNSGALVPRLSARWQDGQGEMRKDDLGRPELLLVKEERVVVNDGYLPVTVTGVSGASPGLALRSAGVHLPQVIEPGETLPLALSYAVTDCGTAPETIDLRVRVDRWWGTAEAGVPFTEDTPPWIRGPVTSVCELE